MQPHTERWCAVSNSGATRFCFSNAICPGMPPLATSRIRAMAHERLNEVVTGVAKLHRGEARLDLIRGEPPVENDAEMVALVESTAKRAFGEDSVVRLSSRFAARDRIQVADLDQDPVAVAGGADGEPAAAVHALHGVDGVVDQVRHHLTQPRGVDPRPRPVLRDECAGGRGGGVLPRWGGAGARVSA